MGTGSSAGNPQNFDADGNLRVTGPAGGSSTQSYALLTNGAATGSATSALPGGKYIWAALGTFSGATLTLQVLGPDGSTQMDVASLTAAGAVEVNVGSGSVMRVAVSGGPPSGIYSTLQRVN